MGKGTLATRSSKSGNDPLSTSSKNVRQHAAKSAAGMAHASTFKNAKPAPKAQPNAKTAPKTTMPKSDKGSGKARGAGAQLGGAK
jgi:hypothetical protein